MNRLTGHPRFPWLIAFTAFLSFALTVGVTQYAFSVFVTELEDDLHWRRAEVMAALSLYAISALAALPTGWLLDRVGARPVMAVCVALLAVSHLLRPWMGELWHFYALHAIQFAAMPGATALTGARLVAIWFENNRGRAMGMTMMGANVGGIVFSGLTAALIGAIGWRGSYLVYGLLFAALVPMVLLVVRERPLPREGGGNAHQATGNVVAGLRLAEVLRLRVFYFIALGLVIAQLTYQSLLPQIVPHLENVGISRTDAAIALSLFAFFGMAGKLVLGGFCDRYPARYAIVISLSLQIVGILVLLFVGPPLLWLFVPIFGFGFGSLGAIMPLLVQETFGLRSFGTIFGTITFLTMAPALVGPPLIGASFDATGSYQVAFLTVAGLFALAAIAVASTRPVPPRPRPAVAAVEAR